MAASSRQAVAWGPPQSEVAACAQEAPAVAAGGGVSIESWACGGQAGAAAGCPAPDDAEAAAWRGSWCHHALQNP